MTAEFLRYVLTGLLNTAVGYAAFLLALHGLELGVFSSNIFSYAAGLSVAYVLNITFVFRGSKHSAAAVLKFLACFALSFAVNMVTLYVATQNGSLPDEVSQLIAMAAYTVSFYLLNKYVVWSSG